MDNQPLPSAQPKPSVQPQTEAQPATNPGDLTNPNTVDSSTSGDVVLEAGKKKRKKLIISLVSLCAVLLVCGGAFAAAVIISNQPENIALSAFNNLMNAKQIAADGTIDLAISESENIGVEGVKINLGEQSSGIANSTTANIEVDFTNSVEPATFEISETLLTNGVLYLKADGLKTFYDESLSDTIRGYLTAEITNGLVDDEAALNPEIQVYIDNYTNSIMNQVGNVIQSLDGQWLRISFEEIASSEYSSGVDPDTTTKYNCVISTANNFANYSNEFSDLYTKNQFVVLSSGADSFYNISINADKLTNYLNALPATKFVADLSSCSEESISEEISEYVSADEVNSVLAELPQISAKFDGLFNHHLTELRVSQQKDEINLNADVKLSYPNNVNIVEPENSRSIIEVISEILQQINGIESTETTESIVIE